MMNCVSEFTSLSTPVSVSKWFVSLQIYPHRHSCARLSNPNVLKAERMMKQLFQEITMAHCAMNSKVDDQNAGIVKNAQRTTIDEDGYTRGLGSKRQISIFANHGARISRRGSSFTLTVDLTRFRIEGRHGFGIFKPMFDMHQRVVVH